MIRLLLSLLFTIVLTSCASPEARKRADEAERQKDLREEAREKFEEQKEKDHDRAEEVADARRRAAEDAERYRAYEAEYARQLGKKPSQLTPEERQWVREHF